MDLWYLARLQHHHRNVLNIMPPSSLLLGAFYSLVSPTPVSRPRLVAHSQPALALLSLAPSEAARPEFPHFLSGSLPLPGSQPAAHCYCGHQFGYFSGQLGDGCAQYVRVCVVCGLLACV